MALLFPILKAKTGCFQGPKLPYREQILEHHRTPHNFGQLAEPTISVDGRNPSCGDLITMQLQLDAEGLITDVAFSGRGCAISQASAS
uniref:iron-sulfur cluster assembly scaffold protein n=1 Tax=Candidatus Limnocylindrus sp. TaxID=2802978 RepID=UPI00404B6A52